jgi:uncharacterized protein YggE
MTRRLTLPSGSLVLLGLVVLAQSAKADPTATPRTVSTTGESSVYVTPDEVIVNVGVETFNASLDAAKQDNDERSKTLLTAIKDAGVEAKHVQTDEMNVSIEYRGTNPKREVVGYLAHREYRVTLKDAKKTQSLVDASLKHGANLLLGIDYRSTELRKHRDEARKMAVRAAKEKAELLAGELGEQVARPRTITEGSFGYFGWAGRWAQGNSWAQNSVKVQDNGAGVEGETIPIGQIAITASVSVTFDLKD